VICLVGKSWGYHVDEALGVPRAENLAMVADSIAYLRSQGKRVFFDAEHFFDGYARDHDYAREVVVAAAEAGAECVVLCDTNGGAMPWDVTEIVRELVDELPCDVGLHFHDDGGCAVANSLLGIEAGGCTCRAPPTGWGSGAATPTCSRSWPTCSSSGRCRWSRRTSLERLTEVSHTIAELCNQSTPSVQPYVGHTAFATRRGIHASALAKAPDMYNHIDPARSATPSAWSSPSWPGGPTSSSRPSSSGWRSPTPTPADVLEEVKRREALGWSYEAADASFELLLRRLTGRLAPGDEPFHSQHYRVNVAGW
jgi:2-isopropylmalate synthase